jgi:hypothetical protein
MQDTSMKQLVSTAGLVSCLAYSSTLKETCSSETSVGFQRNLSDPQILQKPFTHCGSWDPNDFDGLAFFNAYEGNGSLNKVSDSFATAMWSSY